MSMDLMQMNCIWLIYIMIYIYIYIYICIKAKRELNQLIGEELLKNECQTIIDNSKNLILKENVLNHGYMYIFILNVNIYTCILIKQNHL